MRGTASSERGGVVVTDRWGGNWRVSCFRAGVLPAPVARPDAAAVGRLLLPWGTPTGSPPPPPRASWVLGRSTRWQGWAAPGAGADPWREEVSALRPIALTAGLGSVAAFVLLLRGRRIRQLAAAERTHPWLVELTACAGPARSAVWLVEGPDAAQAAVGEVTGAVQAGRPPAPTGGRLLDVQDRRS
ncbi:hypothetical protein O2W15_23355 [Modestobacter sp. VKM Ac-2979]|uniref:hypothetical protein n=1 Tax=unclassified Modestobacter TaxID=2643866 RepID=UPI0022AB58DC|nr:MULTISPECIES: hypothetical protein [unclassified Modestobacter]MCZ2814379.1 hypothetical protein [Modestobacter sp. VKM Ac-2979]MCZ2843929.1 hypothetical protein [Modestobacter sp. VKM Ac-2980]